MSARQPSSGSSPQDAYQAERTRLLRIFGEKLRAARERRNLSQDALARQAAIHRTQVGMLESGQREPLLTTLLILAHTLAVPPSQLIDGLLVPRERKAPTHSKGGRAG